MNTVLKTIFATKKRQYSFVLLLFILPSISLGAIYKWVDENGETHYGSKQPESAQSQRLNIKTREPAAPITTTVDAKSENTTDKEGGKNNSTQPQPEKDTTSYKEKIRLCKQAESDVLLIEAKSRIRERDDNGNVRYLSDQERNQRLAAARQLAKNYCR